ncbi:hypothetical protein [Streptomyces litchfieldiae]|uniref:Uncharacterized protein n=1 Tax=Streptomyces litchfieldiae TaxID=3075543 RepID=A0ABU2MN35_9ACTN|nr:hypothetical protein [Streptomyces sp. DSM 44938]MDT0342069.1 hypothetical protein [Streptomyces sp. DSM 44938]
MPDVERSDDELAEIFRESDPVAHRALPDADGPLALRIRTRIHIGRRRRVVLIPAVAACAMAATAGGYAWIDADGTATVPQRQGHAVQDTAEVTAAAAPIALGCGDHGDALAVNVAYDTPEDRCRDLWTNAPEELVTCAPSAMDYAVMVLPGGPEECAANDATVWEGPTDEQRGLSLVAADLAATLDEEGQCLTPEEVAEITAGLLEEHGVDDWTVETGDVIVRATPGEEIVVDLECVNSVTWNAEEHAIELA